MYDTVSEATGTAGRLPLAGHFRFITRFLDAPKDAPER
jgi:hypothetical protein